MARVEEKGGLMVRAAQWYAKRSYGREITITPVIAHSRATMLGWGALEWGQDHSHRVDERLKDLAATRVATRVGCEFCIDIASALGRKAGVSDEQLRHFHEYRPGPRLSDEQKLVMEHAQALTDGPVQVSGGLFGPLR